MKDRQIISDEIIARYLAGELAPDEALMLHEWLEVSENMARFETFQQTWNASYPQKKPSPLNQQRAWKILQEEMLRVPKTEKEKSRTILPAANGNSLYKIAATFLIFAVAAIFAYLKFGNIETVKQSEIAANEMKPVILPDHSRVVLSPHAALTFNKNFDSGVREVDLSGEAFFNVTHDASRPFIVHTIFADVRVVGTAFNVAVKNNKVEVSVAEGKVLVYTAIDSIYLTPGREASVNGSAPTKISPSVDADINDWGYATRKFEFKNALLSEVFACIEKSYPCSIKVQNEAIKNCKLTATFDNASAEYIVTLVAETLNLTLTKKGNVFYLEGKGCL